MDRRILYAGLLVVAGAGLVRTLHGPRIRPGVSRLLVIGDEFATGLALPINALGKEAKITVDALTRSGATVEQFLGPLAAPLGEKIRAFKPTLILVSLGTNDDRMASLQIAQKSTAIDQLLGLLASSGCEVLWIGPPKTPWASRGVTSLLREKIAKASYFRSDALAIPRGPDGLMPTARGFAGWAGSIWRWVS